MNLKWTEPPVSGIPPRLTVVIVNYNGWPDVARLVADLAGAREVQSGICSIVIVDNASDGPVPPSLCPPPIGVRLIERPDNGGFAAGVNAGWKASRSPWLLLLNPDVEPGDDLLDSILARIDHHERRDDGPPGILGFALRNPDASPQPSVGAEIGLIPALFRQLLPRSRRSYHVEPEPGEVAWVTGACLLVSSEFMRAVGGMDEDFFLYYEEVALCRSAWGAGWRVEFDDLVSVVHLRPLQNRAISPKIRVIVRHAKLLFFRKHQPRWQYLALCGIVAVEATARGWLAKLTGNFEAFGAWRVIGRMARSMRRGEVIRGREVLALADAASSTRSHAPRGNAVFHAPRALGSARSPEARVLPEDAERRGRYSHAERGNE